MNWAGMTPEEVRSYAPLYASTDLERALIAALDEAAQAANEANDDARSISSELEDAQSEQARAERDFEEADGKLERIYEALEAEEVEDAERLAAIRRVFEG